ncbi:MULTISPECIES: precorrin-4 C(11)-methyltransferase [Methanothermobacter]|uniref:Cobalt-precorrin 4 C11-methyltransferase n=1 Tax=Methanothermobacter defluvii TaxID=49339 RepID=A0A371NE22_9EURY|nr:MULTISPECIES: precorrin-4 C(11)-methyltransferase [Methanothermobacter]NLU03906.1 precorrin-4 C(11)-methyltransferase [Methanothermobacter sp.]MDI6817918.1 precorrin-4 C(11)-methyltransferase [Methanothermobacter thermautotrophicus]REE28752.1 cobalt-precorrin 4 C11-methyltransferase [Methanothermobacter defluvii]WBF08644.1 precorrin-4 C(11)-methyltransferase [Methanothermobacter thermautotrophicus]BAM69775.1 precorrin-3 methylase [Methanothermobacter sp. CaT2]
MGAGPGDPELITLKAVRALRRADVVIYAGSLVNRDILEYAPEDAEVHNSAHMDLEEITDIMVEACRAGKTVARVHTGDPSIYGAIKEQIRVLEKNSIPYTIIPGVSSVFAAAAALNTELTLPEVSQTVIITRPAGRTPVPPGEDLEELAVHGSTMCIFLGVHMIGDVAEKLMTHYPPDTPVAVVKRASWPDEEVVRGTLSDIAERVRAAGISKTAMIIVGRVLEPGDFKASKLYDAGFSHEYRP